MIRRALDLAVALGIVCLVGVLCLLAAFIAGVVLAYLAVYAQGISASPAVWHGEPHTFRAWRRHPELCDICKESRWCVQHHGDATGETFHTDRTNLDWRRSRV